MYDLYLKRNNIVVTGGSVALENYYKKFKNFISKKNLILQRSHLLRNTLKI